MALLQQSDYCPIYLQIGNLLQNIENLFLLQQSNTLTVTHLSLCLSLSLVLMMKNVSVAVLLCPSLVLYALLKSVLVYFSCSLENFEFVKSEVKC